MPSVTHAGADEVLYVPSEELVEESIGDLGLGYRPNPDGAEEALVYPAKPKRARKPKALPESRMEEAAIAADLYGGHDGFLVRTALIRSNNYDPTRAPQLGDERDVVDLVKHLKFADQEHFVIISVNAQLRLLAIHESAVGGRSTVQIELGQILKVAFLSGARAVFIVHNHPSGDPTPSPEDVAMTKVAKSGLSCVDVLLHDHIIVARRGYASFRNMGLL